VRSRAVRPEGECDPITVSSYWLTEHGQLTVSTSGHFSYTPNPDYVGPDGFQYRISDGTSSSEVAAVTLTVLPPSNRAPFAVADHYLVPAGEELDVSGAEGLLRNDFDFEGDGLLVQSYQSPANGLLDLAPDGSFTYTPDPDYTGVEVLHYNLLDSQGAPSDQPGELRLLVGVYGDIVSGVLTPPTPDGFALHAPVPNPFNPRTEIAYRTVAAGHVELRILDLQGRVVATLVNMDQPAGEHTIAWTGSDDAGGRVASGVYVTELRCGAERAVQKVTLLK